MPTTSYINNHQDFHLGYCETVDQRKPTFVFISKPVRNMMLQAELDKKKSKYGKKEPFNGKNYANFPYVIKRVDESINKRLMEDFSGKCSRFLCSLSLSFLFNII